MNYLEVLKESPLLSNISFLDNIQSDLTKIFELNGIDVKLFIAGGSILDSLEGTKYKDVDVYYSVKPITGHIYTHDIRQFRIPTNLTKAYVDYSCKLNGTKHGPEKIFGYRNKYSIFDLSKSFLSHFEYIKLIYNPSPSYIINKFLQLLISIHSSSDISDSTNASNVTHNGDDFQFMTTYINKRMSTYTQSLTIEDVINDFDIGLSRVALVIDDLSVVTGDHFEEDYENRLVINRKIKVIKEHDDTLSFKSDQHRKVTDKIVEFACWKDTNLLTIIRLVKYSNKGKGFTLTEEETFLNNYYMMLERDHQLNWIDHLISNKLKSVDEDRDSVALESIMSDAASKLTNISNCDNNSTNSSSLHSVFMKVFTKKSMLLDNFISLCVSSKKIEAIEQQEFGIQGSNCALSQRSQSFFGVKGF